MNPIKQNFWDEWFAGVIDGDGCVAANTVDVLQNPGATITVDTNQNVLARGPNNDQIVRTCTIRRNTTKRHTVVEVGFGKRCNKPVDAEMCISFAVYFVSPILVHCTNETRILANIEVSLFYPSRNYHLHYCL